jgi:hypothetical protein
VRSWLRYLRIAVSGLSLIGCLLLAVLWVRSYWRRTQSVGPLGSNTIWIISGSGQMQIAIKAGLRMLEGHSSSGEIWSVVSPWVSDERGIRRFANLSLGKSPTFHLTGVFSFLREPTTDTVWIPYWLPTYLLGGMALLPWMKWPPRFGLRTLLLATPIVAVLIAIAVHSLPEQLRLWRKVSLPLSPALCRPLHDRQAAAVA